MLDFSNNQTLLFMIQAYSESISIYNITDRENMVSVGGISSATLEGNPVGGNFVSKIFSNTIYVPSASGIKVMKTTNLRSLTVLTTIPLSSAMFHSLI